MWRIAVLVFSLFDATISKKSQSVNLELETVFELENDKDIRLLTNIQEFVDKIKNVIKNSEKIKTKRQNKSQSLTELLINVIETVNSLRDEEITEIFGAAGDEVKAFNFEDSFEDSDTRRLLSSKLDDLSKNPSKVRASLDQLLRHMDKNNKLTKFINIIYSKDSKKSISRFLKKLVLFRRNSRRPENELKVIAENTIRDILDKYDNLMKHNKQIVQSIIKSFTLISDGVENEYIKKENMSNSFEADDVKNSSEEENKEETRILKSVMKRKKNKKETPTIRSKIKRTKASKRLTYITLYPSSIEIKNGKRNFKNKLNVKSSKTVESEDDDDKKDDTTEEETENTNELNDDSIKQVVEKEIMDISDDEPTTVTNLKTLRYHKNGKTKTNEPQASSKKIPKFDISTPSHEQFGSLQNESKIKKPTTFTDEDLSEENITFFDRESRESTKMLNNNLYLNRRAESLVADKIVTAIKSIEKDDVHTKVTQNISGRGSSETTEKYIDNKKVDDTFIEKPTIPTTDNDSSTTIDNSFDVNNFLNNSETHTIRDGEKKKKIEDIMKEDFSNLFPTSTNSTSGYTDMFKELEDAFDFS